MNNFNELNRLLKQHHSYVKADRRFPAIMFHPVEDKIRVENEIQANSAIERGFSFDDPSNGADHPHANDEARKKFLAKQVQVQEPPLRRVGRPRIPRVDE